jgi:hypothetical protein
VRDVAERLGAKRGLKVSFRVGGLSRSKTTPISPKDGHDCSGSLGATAPTLSRRMV